APHVSFLTVVSDPLGFLVVTSILVVLLSVHRSRVAADRQHDMQELEGRYRQILEAAFDSILIHRDDRLLDGSHHVERLFGYSEPDGLSLSKLIAEQQHSESTPDARICDVLMQRQDGSRFFAEIITVEWQAHDQPVSVTAVRDVSRARRIEAALRESERRFRLVTESSPDFIYIWEASHDRVSYFNRDGFLGYTREELAIPGYLTSTAHTDDWSAIQAHWQMTQQQHEGETTRPIDYRVRHKQGHWEWLERRDTVLVHDDTRPLQILVTLRVVTERKHAEEDLRQREQHNRALIEAIPDMIIRSDRDGNYLHLWPAKIRPNFKPLLPPEELPGKNVFDVLPPELAERSLAGIRQTLDTGEMVSYEYQLNEHGEIRHYEVRRVPYDRGEVLSIVRDVTERKRAEDHLRREASIFQNVFEAIIVTDRIGDQFYIRRMNQAAERLYGWREDEVRGQAFVDMIQPVFQGGMTRDNFVRELFSQEHWSGDVVHHHRDGTALHVLGAVTVLRDEHGEPTGAIAIALDITRVLAAETALRMSEERFRTALKGSPIVVSNQNRDLRYSWMHNPTAQFDPDRVLGQRDSDLMERAEDAQRVEALKRQVLETGVGLRRAVQWQDRGQIRHFDLTIEPVRDESGAIMGITCAQVDITGRVQEEEARQKIQQMLQTVISNVPILVWSVDRNGLITLAEGSALRDLGVASSTLVNHSIFELIPGEMDFLVNLQRALLGESVTSFDQYRGAHYQTYFHPLRDQTDAITDMVMVTVDISERTRADQHRLELALERERIELLQRFMGDVSHDFKTPLTSIKLSLYLLGKVTTEDDRQRHIDVIARQTDRLENFVRDLFSMSRLDESITGEFDFGAIDLNTLLHDVLIAHDPIIREHRHHARLEPAASLPPVFGDRFQLERVFTNLLINAVHYTPDGGLITLRTGQENQMVIATVSDTGMGIAPEDHERVFARFYRGDRARGAETGGMGVGLAIARKIVETHGGSIELDSTPGKGSTFKVILPVLLT
ncbi:MAG: PAS domain S-box protein, partial [Anaerolineae bacterium]|nr:PAS domain S-box protein [Anaerolineae bacterium]